MKRYWFSILILAAGLAGNVVLNGGDLMNFLDIPSFFFTAVIPLLFVAILFGFKEMRRAFLVFRNKENEHGTLLTALVFFKTYSKATWIAAFIAVFTAGITLFADMENKAVIGPNIALAIVSLIYCGVVHLAVIIPHTVLIHKQLGNGKIRSDILSIFGSLFGVIFISLLLLSLFIPFSSAEQSEDFEIDGTAEEYQDRGLGYLNNGDYDRLDDEQEMPLNKIALHISVFFQEEKGRATVRNELLTYWLYQISLDNMEELKGYLYSYVESIGYIVDYDSFSGVYENPYLATSVRILMSLQKRNVSVTISHDVLIINVDIEEEGPLLNRKYYFMSWKLIKG